jgi:hypothetical protein
MRIGTFRNEDDIHKACDILERDAVLYGTTLHKVVSTPGSWYSSVYNVAFQFSPSLLRSICKRTKLFAPSHSGLRTYHGECFYIADEVVATWNDFSIATMGIPQDLTVRVAALTVGLKPQCHLDELAQVVCVCDGLL